MATSLQPDLLASQTTIAAYDPGRVQVGATLWTSSFLLSPTLGALAWPIESVQEVTAEVLDGLRARQPALIILGTGRRLALLPAMLQARLLSVGPGGEPPVGLECMDTAAACRTYNLLAGEGRQVLAALIVES